VPEELRMAYRLLNNARFLSPEMELRKGIHNMWDLLKTTKRELPRNALVKVIEKRVIRLDLIGSRYIGGEGGRLYTQKLLSRLYAHMESQRS